MPRCHLATADASDQIGVSTAARHGSHGRFVYISDKAAAAATAICLHSTTVTDKDAEVVAMCGLPGWRQTY